MIKDAIANIARDRELPKFSSHSARKSLVIAQGQRELGVSGTEFHPPSEGGTGIVDVNVLYHSLSGARKAARTKRRLVVNRW